MDQVSEFAPQSRNTEFKELGEGHQEVREAPSPQYEKTSSIIIIAHTNL